VQVILIGHESLQDANSEDEVCYDSLHDIVRENLKARSTDIDVEDVGSDHVIHCELLTAIALMITMMTATMERVHHKGAVEMQPRVSPQRATTTLFTFLLMSIVARGVQCTGCGARNLSMQSQGCGAGNIKIQTKGISNCSTATLNYSLTIDSHSEIFADGDFVIKKDAIVNCENCKIQAIGKVIIIGTLACTSSLCKLEVEGSDIQVQSSGRITGGDVILVAESLRVLGIVSTSGQGYVEEAGDGKGNKPSYGSSYDSAYRVSGSGAGHGGNGAGACFRYSSSFGNIPSGQYFAGMHAHASLCNRRGLSD